MKTQKNAPRLAAVVLLGASMLLAGAAAPGCGGGNACESYCELARDCDDLDLGGDCIESCQQQLSKAEAVDCGSEFESALECAADAADVCKPNECVAEVFAFVGCAQAFCEQNPNHAECGSVGDTDPPPG